MGMTITEKLLANRAEVESVSPGQLIVTKLDVILGTDATAPLAIEIFRRMGATKVFNPDQIVIVNDHFAPARDIHAAELARTIRAFVAEQGIKQYYDGGKGISHLLLAEEGAVVPGDVVIGADSHTCSFGALGAFSAGVGSTDMAAAWALGELWMRVPQSMKIELTGKLQPWVGGKDLALRLIADIGLEGARYKAIEYCGSTIAELPFNHRVTLCNMSVEAGAKNAIIAADETTLAWIRPRAKRNLRLYKSDPDSTYAETRRYDVADLTPQVACPPSPDNVKPVEALERITVDQVVIGSCTNGMIEDLRAACAILRGHTVNPNVRLIVMSGTHRTLRQAAEEGLISTLLDAGAVLLPPGCGPCSGGHLGLLASDEVALTTTARNYPGQMGALESKIYIANPGVAAATALTGHITDPRTVTH